MKSYEVSTMQAFINVDARVLVTTDLAARGLDLYVSHVINYDLPPGIDIYVQRCGRTGRAGRAGTLITFVSVPRCNFCNMETCKDCSSFRGVTELSRLHDI